MSSAKALLILTLRPSRRGLPSVPGSLGPAEPPDWTRFSPGDRTT